MNEQLAKTSKGDVLIVDDTIANLRLLSRILTDHGYKVRAASDGEHALDAARTIPPDLILLDINMPEMDGYEVCHQLKADPLTADIAILFLSALDETEDKVKGFTAGAVDYVTKPFQFEELLARVETHLALRRLQKSLQQEITEHQRTEEALQQSNARLTRLVNDLEARTREVSLLAEVSGLLQVCNTAQECYTVVAHSAQKLLPAESGALFTYMPEQNCLEALTVWGALAQEAYDEFHPEACWALRRTRSHLVADAATGLLCQHLGQPQPASYLCTPMMAQGEILGIFHLRWSEIQAPAPEVQAKVSQLAAALAEHLSVTLTNLKLRETLRTQSIRDGLTGLFNRRYMDETLEREYRRAVRQQRPFSLLLFDIDHFKKFNDLFGHDAGDTLLREVGRLFKAYVRASDIPCRYGGEEFLLILPETPLASAQQRAEDLCAAARAMQVYHQGKLLDVISFSVGVSTFPEHGQTVEHLLRAADAALYAAKVAGRDRVIVATIGPAAAAGDGTPAAGGRFWL